MSKEYHDSLNSPGNGEQHVREQLWPYIDGDLPAAERDAVRAHLESCAGCRADYLEMRATRQMLSSMPVVPAPRAFTLTPEMVGRNKPSLFDRLFAPRYAPRFATGSVLTFVLLFVIFAANVGIISPSTSATFSKIGSGLNGSSSESSQRNAGAEANPMAASAAATATTGTFAESTVTTAAGGMGGAIPPEGTPEIPTGEPSTSAMQAPQPQATPAPGEQPPAQDLQGLTATEGSEASTPAAGDTTAANTAPNATDESRIYDRTPADSSPANVPQAFTSGQPVESSQVALLAVQLGLLGLGLALAFAAVIARRHGSG